MWVGAAQEDGDDEEIIIEYVSAPVELEGLALPGGTEAAAAPLPNGDAAAAAAGGDEEMEEEGGRGGLGLGAAAANGDGGAHGQQPKVRGAAR